MQPYEQKAQEVFGQDVILKGLAREAGISRLPRYASEWLLNYFAHQWGATNPLDCLQMVRENVARAVPDPEHRESVLQQLRTTGGCFIYDCVEARVDLKTNKVVAKLSNLNLDNIRVFDQSIERIPQLLVGGGVWCSLNLKYLPHEREAVELDKVTAFQDPVDFDQFCRARRFFTTEEWIDLLLTSVGYEPQHFTSRQKLLLLVRLAPVVEANTTLVELGPRQTGKTFLLRNIAPSCYTASGAQVTAASLFANIATGAPGVLLKYKTVMLDEVAHTTIDDPTTVSIMKDYLESGQFSRGGRSFTSDASLVLAGNLEVQGAMPSQQYRHLFESLPTGLQDTALLDRVNGYLPGWEIPVLQPHLISTGVGLTAGYTGQVLQLLRKLDRRNYCHSILAQLGLLHRLTTRDLRSVERITSALLKLVFPDNSQQYADLGRFTVLALELRNRVVEQLAIMSPGEFGNRVLMA